MVDSSSTTPLAASALRHHSSFGATEAACDPESQAAGKLKDTTPLTKIPAYVSTKLKVLLLTSILGAVTIHSCNLYTNGYDHYMDQKVADLNTFVQSILISGFLRSCVPTCYAISGLLFFKHGPDDTPDFQFWKRLSARLTSIGLPFVLWSVVAAVQLSALCVVPYVAKVYPDSRFVNPTLHTLLFVPAGGQLWYLRDLLLLVFLTPVFHRLFRLHHLVLLLVPMSVVVPWFHDRLLFSGWCFLSVCPTLDLLRPDAIIFFTVGCYLALRGVDLERKLPGWRAACLALAWLCLILLKVGLIHSNPEGGKTRADFLRIIAVHRIGEPLGVAAMWFGYDFLHPHLSTMSVWPWVQWFANYSMWIYCCHSPLCNVWVAVGRNLLLEHNAGPWAFLALFLFTPIIIVTLTMLVGLPLSHHCPSVFGLLTGGRGG